MQVRELSFSLFFILIMCLSPAFGQGGYHFGTKGGATMANQNWNGGDRRPYLSYHINAFVETRDPDERGALFAQLGFHNRGSSIGFRTFDNLRNSRAYEFQNISLMLGAKKLLFQTFLGAQPYYFLGVRGEYNLNDNLREMQDFFINLSNNSTNPDFTFSSFISREPAFIQKWLYGISIGGGLQFEGGEFFNTALEITLSPDLNYQYDQGPSNFNGGNSLRIRNVSFEVSLVLRFLREVIYE